MEAGTTDMVLTQAGLLAPFENAVAVWIGPTGNNLFFWPTMKAPPTVPLEVTVN